MLLRVLLVYALLLGVDKILISIFALNHSDLFLLFLLFFQSYLSLIIVFLLFPFHSTDSIIFAALNGLLEGLVATD